MTKNKNLYENMMIFHMVMIMFAIAGAMKAGIGKFYAYLIFYVIIAILNLFMCEYWAERL